ncbi:tyrosine-type recombinase/integrase [Rhizobium sp. Root1204]|uniref:tyrosine-type recombinase/integrase n=1 Tax=Rhizobium sp. Root1204 TaxID=1736428 RepID=UPI000713142B|nr:tyrosine-type recombinase/integrase [Rhizobium sp. Root1204]KQV28836.1 hypothetical protein ASC96_15825 [Rhizobium sp. Root1204]
MDFEVERVVSGKRWLALTPITHALLIQQLKEVMVAMMFSRNLLPGRIEAAKPLTILRQFQPLSQLFTNFAAEGVVSLGQIDQWLLDRVFSLLPVTEKSHAAMIAHFSDLNTLTDLGMITASFSIPNVSIQTKRLAEDTERQTGARTLHEDETSHILSCSRAYIESASTIADQLIARRKGLMSSSALVEWSYQNLPVTQGLSKRNIEGQLTWLIKISAYQILVFHLGSRASEGLSLTKDAIFATKDKQQRYRAFVRLIIFKGTKTGSPRTYRVHPYLLRVDAALKSLANAIGRSSDEIVFSKRGQDEEVATNSLNDRIKRFAKMHGAPTDVSSHSGRFTLADVVAQSADNPFAAIQYQLGHSYIAESVAYGMHGPSGSEMRSAGIRAMANGINSFVERCLDEPELGGIHGLAISEALNKGVDGEELKRQMKGLGIFPLKIGVDRYCVKQGHARGACSAVTGDDLPETEYCEADCQFQAQFASHRIRWEKFIAKAPRYYADPSVSTFEKIKASDELLKNVSAWPQLRPAFSRLLIDNPEISKWFT